MSNKPERLLETPTGIRLCALSTIEDGKARNFVIEVAGQHFHGFVVRRANEVRGYVDSCPHMQMPLAQKLDDYLTPDGRLIACSWHGALFEFENGLCVGGPCTGQNLRPWPVKIENEHIVTGH